jgi:hypothetical protein
MVSVIKSHYLPPQDVYYRIDCKHTSSQTVSRVSPVCGMFERQRLERLLNYFQLQQRLFFVMTETEMSSYGFIMINP